MMIPSCRCVRLSIALVALLCLCANAGAVRGKKRGELTAAKRVLLVSLDGLDARYLARRDEWGLKIPTLRRLIAEGVTARSGVVSVYPSLTYPAHTTMVTGASPSRHAIFGNEVFDPTDPASKVGIWFARDIRAETLWDAAAHRHLSIGIVSWPVAAGAGDWNVPEIWRPAGTQQETLQDIAANARPPGLVEEIAASDSALYAQVTKDEQDDMRTRFAEYLITEKRPRVMLVHLFDLDHFQHLYGPFTPEAFAMLEKADAYVARLLAACERAGTLFETDIFVTSDHGFRPISQLIHPGVLLARAGLLKTRQERDAAGGSRVVVAEWRAAAYVTAGSCAIILRDPKDTDALRRARRALSDFRSPQTGARVFRVLDAAEVRRLGSNTRAALMLDAAAGYSFGRNLTGDAITPSKDRGQHGYLPMLRDYRASFVAAGIGVTRRGDVGAMRMIDIGPTVAKALNLRLRDARGRALKLR